MITGCDLGTFKVLKFTVLNITVIAFSVLNVFHFVFINIPLRPADQGAILDNMQVPIIISTYINSRKQNCGPSSRETPAPPVTTGIPLKIVKQKKTHEAMTPWRPIKTHTPKPDP